MVLVLPLLMEGSARSDTRVLLDGGRVSIHAESTPLSEVLSRFAQVTGAEIVFESTRPQQLVSVGIETGSEAEALVRLLEGQGLNYALRLDPTGRKVELLFISSPKGGTGAATLPSPRTLRPGLRPERPHEEPEETQTFAPDIVEEPDPTMSGTVQERVINPVWAPTQPEAPVTASYPGTSAVPAPGPGMVPSPASSAPPPSYPDSPSYPGRASYPGSSRE